MWLMEKDSSARAVRERRPDLRWPLSLGMLTVEARFLRGLALRYNGMRCDGMRCSEMRCVEMECSGMSQDGPNLSRQLVLSDLLLRILATTSRPLIGRGTCSVTDRPPEITAFPCLPTPPHLRRPEPGKKWRWQDPAHPAYWTLSLSKTLPFHGRRPLYRERQTTQWHQVYTGGAGPPSPLCLVPKHWRHHKRNPLYQPGSQSPLPPPAVFPTPPYPA